MDEGVVHQLPDSAFLNIFSYLDSKEIVKVSFVCRRWLRISRDEQLWKRRFRIDFAVEDVESAKTEGGWLREYRRLTDECPGVRARKLTGHKERVLHACFSHSGSMLATCSMDGTLKVWSTGGDWRLLQDKNLRQLLYWRHTLCSRFNESDRLLLVSGLRAAESATTTQQALLAAGANGAAGLGELAVFEFVKRSSNKPMESSWQDDDGAARLNPEEDLVFRCRAINEPFDVYGCWFDNESVLNGQSRRFNRSSSMSDLYFLHAASEQTTSTRLFQFYNPTGGVVRSLLVSSFAGTTLQAAKDKLLIFTTGQRVDTAHQVGVKVVKSERVTGPLEAAAKSLKMRSEHPPPPPTVKKTNHERKVNIPKMDSGPAQKEPITKDEQSGPGGTATALTTLETEQTQTQAQAPAAAEIEEKKEPEATEEPDAAEASQANKEESSSEEETDDEQMAAPAQAARVRGEFGKYTESVVVAFKPPALVSVHTFDRVDHIIETHGLIVGMTLSPDQRFVFIYVRPFADVNAIRDLAPNDTRPIPVQAHLEIRVVDLETFTLLDDSFVSQASQTQSGDTGSPGPTYVVALDASQAYLLGGGDGSCAYLWDIRYRCFVRALSHDVGRLVHCVAFHPKDQSTCVSASDDGSLVVWYSRRRERAEKEEQLPHPP